MRFHLRENTTFVVGLSFILLSLAVSVPAVAQSASIAGQIYEDGDGDRLLGSDDPLLAGVSVELRDDLGALLASTTSDAQGGFAFASLAAGDYTIAVDSAALPPAFVPVDDADGVATPHAATVTLAAAENATGLDFAYLGPAAPVSPGIIAYWRFEETGRTVWDTSGHGHHGARLAGLFGGAGRIGKGIAFDGQEDDAVVFGPTPGLDAPSILTLMAWIKHPAASGWHSILDKRDATNDGYDLYVDPSSKLFVRLDNQTLASSTTVADGTWHHVAAVYDGSAIRLYVDGVLDVSSTVGALSIDTVNELRIGENFALGNSFFAGTLDDVRIYERALSGDEIGLVADLVYHYLDVQPPVLSDGGPDWTLAAGTTSRTLFVFTSEEATCRWGDAAGMAWGDMTQFTVTGPYVTLHQATLSGLADGDEETLYLRCRDRRDVPNGEDFVLRYEVEDTGDLASGLTLHLELDDGSGTAAADDSGFGFDAVVLGGAAWTTGKIGGGLELDGVDDAIMLHPVSRLDEPQELTLAAWIRHPAASGWHSILDKRDATADGYDLYVDSSSRLFMRVEDQTLATTVTVADGTWHHVAGTYDGTDLKLYVDGVERATKNVGALGIDVARPLRIGENWDPGNSFFDGTLDDVRIYDRALTAAEVLDLFQLAP